MSEDRERTLIDAALAYGNACNQLGIIEGMGYRPEEKPERMEARAVAWRTLRDEIRRITNARYDPIVQSAAWHEDLETVLAALEGWGHGDTDAERVAERHGDDVGAAYERLRRATDDALVAPGATDDPDARP